MCGRLVDRVWLSPYEVDRRRYLCSTVTFRTGPGLIRDELLLNPVRPRRERRSGAQSHSHCLFPFFDALHFFEMLHGGLDQPLLLATVACMLLR